ncbi:MAG: hypothetical protein KI790_03870 [Cyclobacteriaceae bacterium]|nr:hypothetical protein [Cyclobacteriaceae bacterium HetDA_MAG_MS6]
MLTFIRPIDSHFADEIEKRMEFLVLGCQIIRENILQSCYLVDSGHVMEGDAINRFLDAACREKPVGGIGASEL